MNLKKFLWERDFLVNQKKKRPLCEEGFFGTEIIVKCVMFLTDFPIAPLNKQLF